LLPKTVIAVQNEDGKEIISIKGVAVFVSKILQEMTDLKIQNSNVQEIKIVGLLSVHVDCDLESKDWHGMNVAIVTDNNSMSTRKCVGMYADSTATINRKVGLNTILFVALQSRCEKTY
jgi:hypothetical protein